MKCMFQGMGLWDRYVLLKDSPVYTFGVTQMPIQAGSRSSSVFKFIKSAINHLNRDPFSLVF
jgi:hypothetical protein